MVAQVQAQNFMLAGYSPPIGQYVSNALCSAYGTSAQNQRANRCGLFQLPRARAVDRIWINCTTGGVHGGTNNFAIRIYAADALRNPLAAVPMYVADETMVSSGTDLTTTGEKILTLPANWNLPLYFWYDFVHNYSTTGPTMTTLSTSTGMRGGAASAPAGTPGIGAALYYPSWTEATYDAGAARAYGNAAITWAASGPIAIAFRPAS